MDATCAWRGAFDNDEVNRLHAEGFGHRILDDDWRGQVEGHSFGWVCARDPDGTLVGFVNVPFYEACGFSATPAGIVAL